MRSRQLRFQQPDEIARALSSYEVGRGDFSDYVIREDLRLEAYRRLAAVTTAAEVAEIRSEWEDRYGPVPAPATALLEVARLRAECVRTGIREINVSKGPGFGGPAYIVRLSPVKLRVSQEIRLSRLVKEAVYKSDARQLQLPVRKAAELIDGLVVFLHELIPPDSGDLDAPL